MQQNLAGWEKSSFWFAFGYLLDAHIDLLSLTLYFKFALDILELVITLAGAWLALYRIGKE